MIEIGDQQGQGPSGASRPCELDLEQLLESAAVEQAGERVGARCVAQALDEPGHAGAQQPHERRRHDDGAHEQQPARRARVPGDERQGGAVAESDERQLDDRGPAREEVRGIEGAPHVQQRADAVGRVAVVHAQRDEHRAKRDDRREERGPQQPGRREDEQPHRRGDRPEQENRPRGQAGRSGEGEDSEREQAAAHVQAAQSAAAHDLVGRLLDERLAHRTRSHAPHRCLPRCVCRSVAGSIWGRIGAPSGVLRVNMTEHPLFAGKRATIGDGRRPASSRSRRPTYRSPREPALARRPAGPGGGPRLRLARPPAAGSGDPAGAGSVT